ncbi:hypothetical protein [Halobacillus salinus]|uniref:hypothetical protein n=1 Tax=Halobacillus salinus TaxID=192814 RepID=UPI0009A807C6|nr:hypothetical protein [Halobacillus salinus]
MDKKSYLIVSGIITAFFLFFMWWEIYDPAIHNETMQDFASQSRFQDLMQEDAANKYGTGYSIEIYKSDEKQELPYNVSSDKYYTYTIFIDIKEKYRHFYKSKQWEVLEDITEQFENVKVGEDTKYAGYYDDVFLTYMDEDFELYEYRMNVFGFPKKLNGDEYDLFMKAYYEDGEAVYYR